MNSQFLTETDYLCNKEMPFHSNTVGQNCHTKQSKQSKAKCSEQTETCICHTGLKTLHSKMVFLACITKKLLFLPKSLLKHLESIIICTSCKCLRQIIRDIRSRSVSYPSTRTENKYLLALLSIRRGRRIALLLDQLEFSITVFHLSIKMHHLEMSSDC